jgi:aldehyde dehydrogenase (NAD+)
MCLDEVNFALDHIEEWIEPKKVKTPFTLQPAASFVYPDPFGVCLIISPWNYPFNLAILPLIGAVAAGNCAVIKPSELAPHTAKVLSDMIAKHFDPEYLAVIEGGVEVSTALLAEPFDKIFFTGSTAIGKIVMKAAAEHLTPLTLELGGKSPCIVDSEADLEMASKKIAWGKFLNAGQTCVAPDYILVHKDRREELVERLKGRILEFYGADPARSPDFSRIINERHFDRLSGLLEGQSLLHGGRTIREERFIEPTLVDAPAWDCPIMREEIFGPLLPVLAFEDLSAALEMINARPKPLALYYFGTDPDKQEAVLTGTTAGGSCVNDVIMHISSAYLPFGGVGASGMGAYHGKGSFDTFTHHKSVLKRSNAFDLPVRYAPYKGKLRWVKYIFN